MTPTQQCCALPHISEFPHQTRPDMNNALQSRPDVIRDFLRVDPALVAEARQFPSSILADVAGRRGALSGRIAPLAPSMRIAGPALTVEVRPGDNLMIHAAMAIAKPGDVLVIDGKGDLTSALMGEIMWQQCVALGIAGVVIDGAVRDSEAIRELGFPMYAAGLNPNGPTKFVPGRLNHPISIGGVGRPSRRPDRRRRRRRDGDRTRQGGRHDAAGGTEGGGRNRAHRGHQQRRTTAPGLARRRAAHGRRAGGRGNVVSGPRVQPVVLVTGGRPGAAGLALLAGLRVVYAGKTPIEQTIDQSVPRTPARCHHRALQPMSARRDGGVHAACA